ncbi:MAG: hypothetical protein ACFB0A_05325 [Croceivirga sp.]
MKAYLKIIPYMGIVLGLLGLLLLLSLTFPKYCQLANNDFSTIGLQTKRAMESHSFEMARYHTFKALSRLEKTKSKLLECNCPEALSSAKDTEVSLKAAAKSKSIDISKKHLKTALINTATTIATLEEYASLKETKQ